jgi:hypothetical protein
MDLSTNISLVMPTEGMELPSLEEFICRSGNLKQLSPCMLKWERLIYFCISGNRITSFFDEKTEARVVTQRLGWPNLRFASVEDNQL